jgi:uncharacterized membrane protein YqiK
MSQGAAAQDEAERLQAAVVAERHNVEAALKALEAERARLAARAEAEKQRLQKQVRQDHASPPGGTWQESVLLSSQRLGLMLSPMIMYVRSISSGHSY